MRILFFYCIIIVSVLRFEYASIILYGLGACIYDLHIHVLCIFYHVPTPHELKILQRIKHNFNTK